MKHRFECCSIFNRSTQGEIIGRFQTNCEKKNVEQRRSSTNGDIQTRMEKKCVSFRLMEHTNNKWMYITMTLARSIVGEKNEIKKNSTVWHGKNGKSEMKREREKLRDELWEWLGGKSERLRERERARERARERGRRDDWKTRIV